MAVPNFLVIGQVVADQTDGGLTVGGAAAYAAVTAQRLGLRAAVVTSPHRSLDVRATLPGIDVHYAGPPVSTTFQNLATIDGRVQHWYGEGHTLQWDDIPDDWHNTPIVLLGPVAQDVSPDLASHFPHSLLAASPQGWMRRRSRDGQVIPSTWKRALTVLPHLRVVVVSEEDIGSHPLGMRRLLMGAPVAVITRGAMGALLWSEHTWRMLDAVPARESDPTGAGDVFAAAFLCAYQQSGDASEAGRFACAVAGRSVEGPGLTAIPSAEEMGIPL